MRTTTTASDIAPSLLLRALPPAVRPLALLARWDRPIGIYLLFWPAAWGLVLAAQGMPDIHLLLLYGLGAISMRGAGCTINDILDRHLDGRVQRTALRPLPAGQLTVRAAWLWLALQLLCALIILFCLASSVWVWALASIPLVLLYPLMKRITWWPQAWLGITFNWGVLLGVAALGGTVPAAAWWLYVGAIAWTIGYDTIYATQDTDDDAMLGIRSTARLFGQHARLAVTILYGLAIALWGAAGAIAGLGAAFGLGILIIIALFGWQMRIWRISGARAAFIHNKWVGFALAAALVAGYSAP